MYMEEVAKTPLLTPKEEYELALCVQRGDLHAREKFLRANLRLVIGIAKCFLGRGVSFADLVQEGNMGLMKAVEWFDPRRGFRFSTYATWRVKQFIRCAVRDHGRLIRIPACISEHIGRCRSVLALQAEEGISKGEHAAQKELTRQLPEYAEHKETLAKTVLQTVRGPVMKPLADADALTEWEMSTFDPKTTERNDELASLLPVLGEREREIITLRYGLDDGKPMTLEQVGNRFGVTRERVRQIEKKALKKMRTYGARRMKRNATAP